MLAELRDDNGELIGRMRETHDLCDEHNGIATASLLENWIDESEKRVTVPVQIGPSRQRLTTEPFRLRCLVYRR